MNSFGGERYNRLYDEVMTAQSARRASLIPRPMIKLTCRKCRKRIGVAGGGGCTCEPASATPPRCPADNDGDGNCAFHPNGCIDEHGALRSLTHAKDGDYRFYVVLSKRGKKVALTLNGGALFTDGKLAIDCAFAAIRGAGWTRAVIHEMRWEGEEAHADVGRWVIMGTAVFTPPEKRKKAKL